MSEPEPAGRRPILEFLKLSERGEPYLEGSRCPSCAAIYLGRRLACAKCYGRGPFETVELARTGKLYTYSIVYQSFPGIETPYVSAIVDLDGGGTVKANLLDVEPDPARLVFGMPVELVTFPAPRKDADGNEYLAFGFRPASAAAGGSAAKTSESPGR